MPTHRNTKGQFTAGHPGFKPKGAVSRKKQQEQDMLNTVYKLLSDDIEKNIYKLTPTQRIKLWMRLTEYVRPKLKRIHPSELQALNPVKKNRKIKFRMINVHTGQIIPDPGTPPPVSLSGSSSGNGHPAIPAAPTTLTSVQKPTPSYQIDTSDPAYIRSKRKRTRFRS